MKKALFLLAALTMMFTQPATAQQKVEIDGVEYTFTLNSPANGEATLEMNGNGNSNYTGEFVIPSEFTYNSNSYTVTAIGDDAFKGSDATSITIPATIKQLTANALKNCKSLITIVCDPTIPPTVTNNTFKNISPNKITLVIPATSLDLYMKADGWKDFLYNPADDTDTGGAIVIKTNYEIYDSETLFLEKPITFENSQQTTDPAYNEYNMVSYIRNFKNTNWQALYVPVELVYSDWSEMFEICKVYSILEAGNMFYAMANIVEDKVEPHKLYLIRAKEVGEHTITVSKTHRTDTD
ncbi:MAG: leucine-rich repeat protein, partial [Bacteroidaceae bacterium]|nr:leucine-rich repeat protein [Bacteroidaceae bacterium]